MAPIETPCEPVKFETTAVEPNAFYPKLSSDCSHCHTTANELSALRTETV